MFLQTLIHTIKHFNTTINSKEFTTFLHKINSEIHLSLHLIQLFSTPPPLSVPSNSPPRTNLTTSSGTKFAHWKYLQGGRPMEIGPSPERPPLCHPEQMGRVVYIFGDIGEMGGVRLQEEPISWNGFEPPSLSVAKPFHQVLRFPKPIKLTDAM